MSYFMFLNQCLNDIQSLMECVFYNTFLSFCNTITSCPCPLKHVVQIDIANVVIIPQRNQYCYQNYRKIIIFSHLFTIKRADLINKYFPNCVRYSYGNKKTAFKRRFQ